MKRNIGLILLSVLLIIPILGCENEDSIKSVTNYQQWNSLTKDQRHVKVATELETIKSIGLTVTVNESYFTNRLDDYYKKNSSDEESLKEAILKIGLSNGVIH